MGQLGDLTDLAMPIPGNDKRYFPVRFLKPHASNIIQAYFTARIKLAAGNAAQVYVGPAMFADELNTRTFDMNVETAIKEYHRQLFGSAAPISVPAGGVLAIDAVDISRFITYNPASPLYSRHFFGVTLLFANAPDMTGTYDVQKFKIDASANFGGL